MKKWTIVTLLALLTALLLCSAYAEGEHNWKWEQGETTHIRYCDGCTAYNHTDNVVVDSTSPGHHAYICKWPKTEPQNQNGFIEIGLECNLCSKSQSAKAQMISVLVPTCSRTGSHTYAYADSYATAKYDSETEHTYTVPTVDHQFVEYTPNYDATCTQNGTETAKCKYFYDGCTVTDTREIPNSVLEHDYESRVIKPTCTKGGYTLHTCTRCGDHYSDEETSKRGHWFGEWTPDAESAEGFQRAICRRGCGYTARVECARFDYALNLEGDENTYELFLCPVCGQVHDDIRLARVENATALAVNKSSVLPIGELTVRMGELENGETVMSICFEWNARPTQPRGEIQITLPSEMVNGYTLSLVNADGTETALTTENDGEGTFFTLDFTKLETLALLIRVVPVA